MRTQIIKVAVEPNSSTQSLAQTPTSSKLRLPWVPTALIAIPIFVMCIAVAFNPAPNHGFWPTVISKPEWYFIALVFSVEALLDCYRINKMKGRNDLDSRFGFSILIVIISAALASVAMLSTLTGSFDTRPAQDGGAWEWKPHYMLLAGALPVFAGCAYFYASSKLELMKLERMAHLEDEILADARRPRMYSSDDCKRVKDFYDVVASSYTQRNNKTQGIRLAQDRIVEVISKILATNSGRVTNILDIGGGTGYNIYNSLRNSGKMQWTSVDISPAMTKKFAADFPKAKAITANCLEFDVCTEKEMGQFDVIICSFSLSSMPREIDFAVIRSMLRVGGSLLVAEIHPGYVARSPLFDVDVEQQKHALRLRKVEPMFLERAAEKLGFVRREWDVFDNSAGEYYSYFLRFMLAEQDTVVAGRTP